MSFPAIIFKNEASLAKSLCSYLTRDFDCDITSVSSFTDFLTAFQKDSAPVVFLDLRESSINQETEETLKFLAEDCAEKFQLVVISEGFYPRPLALWVDMIADRHLEYPFHREELVEALGELKQSRLVNGSRRIPRPKRLESEALQFVTYTPELFSVVDQLVRIAALNVTMLLVGKTGTGKTTLAHLIHQLSPRSEEPFQNVACGALPPDLIESELFGHVRGAFTGADRSKIGRFEAAGNGTLLLDEIDVLGPKEQAKLLKVIETGEFEPVGSTETRISNARLIVASNVDLETLTQEQKFRSDLYYRLNVLEFRLPSIKDRPFDIFPLALQFIEECCQQHNISVHRLHRHFIEALKQYPWPGNIRELKNQVQRAVLFCNRDELTVEDLSPAILNMQQEILESAVFQCSGTSLAERVALTERRIVEATLKAHGYKRTATAEALGISRVGLYKKMRKHGMLNGNGNKGG